MPRVASVWLPKWPIERLERAVPGSVPDDRPFALVEKGLHGLLIHAANDRALHSGVRPGVSLADTRAQLPELVARPAMISRDLAALRGLVRWLGRYGPARNIDGRDAVWIDVTGVAHLFGGEERLVADISGRLQRTGVTARVGLADTHAAASALARFGTSTVSTAAIAPAGQVKSAIADLSIASLALAPETTHLLRRLGLKRIGQLYDLPRPALAQRFRAGAKGRRSEAEAMAASVLARLDRALGLIAEPRRPLAEQPQASVRLPFAEPLISSGALGSALEEAAGRLVETFSASEIGARRFRLSLYRADGTVTGTMAATSAACRDAGHICRLLGERLSALDAGFGIDLVELAADGLEPMQAVQVGFDGKGALSADALLVDRLVGRLGNSQVHRLSRQSSHIPGRAQARVPVLSGASARGVPTDFPRHGSRPAFVIEPPEPVEVMAEIPEGAPLRLVWRRVSRRILRSEGPERIGPEWWRLLALPPEDRPRTRDYYRVEDETGGGYWVFREGLYGREEEETGAPRWFVHGVLA